MCRECRHTTRCQSPIKLMEWENRKLKSKGLRICTQCKATKAMGEFYIKGTGAPRSECSECSRTLRQGIDRRKAYLSEQERLSALLASNQYWCTRCKTAKPLSEFYYRNGKPRSQCKACISELTVAAYHADPAKTKERNLVKYHTHKQEFKERQQRYVQTPVGRASRKAIEMRRRARILGVVNENYRDKVAVILRAGLFKCHYCGLMFDAHDLTLDHSIPISRGGPDTWDNIRPSCLECNQAKGTKLESEFDVFAREDALINAAVA